MVVCAVRLAAHAADRHGGGLPRTAKSLASLLILNKAWRAAEESNYRDPTEIFNALRDMAQVARRARSGPLGKNIKDIFREYGWSYRAGISESSSKSIRAQHSITEDGNTYECKEHLNFGVSYDPTASARIYFSSDGDEKGRFVVGHVGRHLDTPTTN